MTYDETQHLHISYNENGLDLEAVGFKQLDRDVWDVYFNFEEHNIDEPLIKFSRIIPFGCKIFSISSRDLSFEEATDYFKVWIKHNHIKSL